MMGEKTNSNQFDVQIAPSAIKVNSGDLQLGDKLVRTLFISLLPRFLTANWFADIINLDRVFDVSIYAHPEDGGKILKTLRDKLARLQAQAMEEEEQGKVRNPVLETALQDIEDLRDKLQQGTDRFFQFGLYITLYATNVKELDEVQAKIKGILDAQLIYLRPATFRMAEGFNSTLPLNSDKLLNHIPLNTEPLSSVFPFVSYDLTREDGILYGINTHNN